MKNENKFRTVNRILGDRPRLGPFPADQIFPWSVIGVVNVFVVSYTFRKDSGQEVLTNVTSEAEYHNYGKRPASEIRA
ncbi:MAG: hypothetical protein RM021_020260 [Nostoc sp. EkiNYC01]|nr:hypothetical protein [Nostoc sp. EkiNYC01]